MLEPFLSNFGSVAECLRHFCQEHGIEWDKPECYDDGDCIFEELLRSCDGAEGANTNFDTTFNKSTGPSTKTSEPITDALTSEPIFDAWYDLNRLTTDERNAVLCCLARLNTSDRCHGASIDAASALVATSNGISVRSYLALPHHSPVLGSLPATSLPDDAIEPKPTANPDVIEPKPPTKPPDYAIEPKPPTEPPDDAIEPKPSTEPPEPENAKDHAADESFSDNPHRGGFH